MSFLIKRVFLVISFALFSNSFFVEALQNHALNEEVREMYTDVVVKPTTYVYLCRYGLEGCDCNPDLLKRVKAMVATDFTCCCGSCKNEGGLGVGFITINDDRDFQGVLSASVEDKQKILWSAFVRFSAEKNVTGSFIKRVKGKISFSYADGEKESINPSSLSENIILRKEYIVKSSGDRYLSGLVKILQTSLFCWRLKEPKNIADIINIIENINAFWYNYTGAICNTYNCASFSVELLSNLCMKSIPKLSFFSRPVGGAITAAVVGSGAVVIACGFPWLCLVGGVLYGSGYLYCSAVRPSKVIEAVLNTKNADTKDTENFWVVIHRQSLNCVVYKKMDDQDDSEGSFYLQEMTGKTKLNVPLKQGRFLLEK